MNENMTLRELLGKLKPVSHTKVPARAMLKKTDTLVAEYEGKDISIAVFESGFAIATFGKRWTVFRVMEECGNYNYSFDDSFLNDEKDTTEHSFEESFFLDLPWTLRLEMTAEDRLEKNNDVRSDRAIQIHPWAANERPRWLMSIGPSAEDEVLRMMRIEELLDSLNELDRLAVTSYYLEGYSLQETAERLSASYHTGEKRITRAIVKLRKKFADD